MSLKSFFTGLLMGVSVALLGVFIWQRRTENAPILAEKFTVEHRPEEVSKPVHKVEAQGQKAVFTYTIPTEYYGNLQGEVQASRSALQYRHRVGIGAVILNNAVMARAGYSYKSLDLSLYGGYDYRRSEAVFGAGIGVSWGF